MGKQDFEKEKLLLELEHKLKMEELAFARETFVLRHRDEMELHRITRADNQRRDSDNFERQKDLRGFKYYEN